MRFFLLPFGADAAAINGSTNGVTTAPTSAAITHRILATNCLASPVRMRGLSGATRVYWTSCGPDPLGLGSGYGVGALTDIVILPPVRP